MQGVYMAYFAVISQRKEVELHPPNAAFRAVDKRRRKMVKYLNQESAGGRIRFPVLWLLAAEGTCL